MDLTGLLIKMERTGLEVDPRPLVDAIRPGLVKQAYLTGSELLIYWYAKERHKVVTEITADGEKDAPRQRVTPAGYRCFMGDIEDRQVRLMVAGPKVAKTQVERSLYSNFPWAEREEFAA